MLAALFYSSPTSGFHSLPLGLCFFENTNPLLILFLWHDALYVIRWTKARGI